MKPLPDNSYEFTGFPLQGMTAFITGGGEDMAEPRGAGA